MERNSVTFEDIERHLLEAHKSSYYAWIRQIMTLAAGSLTALVALRNSYVPANPQVLLLLKACLAGLALSILAGSVALYGEAQTPLEAVQNIRKLRRERGDEETVRLLNTNSVLGVPKKRYVYAQKALFLFFAGALLLLCMFAVLNI
jgi:hypothetical protein